MCRGLCEAVTFEPTVGVGRNLHNLALSFRFPICQMEGMS